MRKKWTSILMALSMGISIFILPMQKVIADTQIGITRSQAEQRSLSMINLVWTYSQDKNSNIDTKYVNFVTKPKQLQNPTSFQFTGIPYNWGGMDGIDSYSYNATWTSFLDAVNKGAYIGNVNSTSGLGLIPGTAGVDCSGFVQATFNIKDYKQSTSTLLQKYFAKIDISSIKHMDILDKPGDHVVIFDKWGTLNGINGAFTYESTPDQTFGGIMGTKQYFLTMNDLNNGYIPARYVNIIEDSAAPMASQFKVPGFAQVVNVNYWANLRLNTGTEATIVATVPKGTILNLLNYSNGWYQVNYNGQLGWLWGNIIGLVPSESYVTVSNVYQLNIRMNASATSQIVGTLTQGQYAKKLDQSVDGSWYKININGVQGWSSSKYLSFVK